MSRFTSVRPQNFDSIFERIGTQKMLISAAADGRANTMTASWGCCGVLWNRPVAICLIRPQRFTYSVMEACNRFSLSFLDEQYANALQFCGTHSGRAGDKFSAAGLTCTYDEDGTPYPAEASDVLICRKIYANMLHQSQFCDSALLSHYTAGDYHKIYIGEITAYLSQIR